MALHSQGTILHAIVADANDGDYLLDASVTIDGVGLEAKTDFFGDARFTNLKKGRYTVHARRIGYAAISTVVDLTGRDSAEITFMMRPLIHELATVKVEESATSAFLREFEQRRKLGKGHYITDSVLRASFASPLEDVITSRIPGVRAIRYPDGSFSLYSARGPNSMKSGACVIAVYWNGIRVGDPSLVPRDFIGGIEFYNPGTTPVEYQWPGHDCGVLLMWPRP